MSVEATTLPSDLLVVVRGDATACDEAMVVAEALLKSTRAASDGGGAVFSMPLTSLALGLEEGARRRPGSDLGAWRLCRRRGDEGAFARPACDAVLRQRVGRRGARQSRHHARDKGLLVMGPDCGTAIVNGVPLGFANVVRRGDIGLVGCPRAPGLQEVTCRIHKPGRRCLAGAGHRRARPEGGDRRHHDAAGAGRACRRCGTRG